MSKKQPLTVEIKNDELVIRMGFETLECALKYMEKNNPYDDLKEDFVQLYSVVEPNELSKDMISTMTKEEEDGSTLLTEFLDTIIWEAIEQGSLGVYNPEDE